LGQRNAGIIGTVSNVRSIQNTLGQIGGFIPVSKGHHPSFVPISGPPFVFSTSTSQAQFNGIIK